MLNQNFEVNLLKSKKNADDADEPLWLSMGDILFHMMGHMQWHRLGITQGYAPPPLVNKRPYIS